jgi:peptide/nickel transport system substrate-binding protein
VALSSQLKSDLAVCAIMLLSCSCAPSWAAGELPQSNQITYGTSWEPLGFYPLRALDSGSYSAQSLVYEGLVKYDSDMNIVPAVAKRFVVGKDGLSYTFSIRQSARFSDGVPVTVDDVVASIELAKAPVSPFKSDFGCIKQIETVDSETIVLHLDRPSAPLLARLAELRILPKRLLSAPDRGSTTLNTQPLGSGPFKLVRWESGLELVFEPNQYYWNGSPQMSRFVWRVVPDKSLLAVAMERGELDVAAIDAATWQMMGGEAAMRPHRLELERMSGTRTIYLGFNMRKKPFSERPVREAVVQSIDREQLANRMYGGMAVVPLSDVPRGSWAYNPSARRWSYDVQAAQRILAENGYALENGAWLKDGQMLALRILTIRDLQDVAQVIADDLVRMHIGCEVQVMEYSTLRARYLKTGDFDAVLWSRSSGPDPECTLVWKTNGALNFSGFSDAHMDALIEAGKAATSRAERVGIYAEIQSILATQLPWDFLIQQQTLIVHRDTITGTKLGNQGKTGLPWDNPLFNAAMWRVSQTSK